MKKRKLISIIVILSLLITCLSGCAYTNDNTAQQGGISWSKGGKTMDFTPSDPDDIKVPEQTPSPIKKSLPEDYMLKIHFLDVGQANATIVQFRNLVFLVDGGNYADARDIIDYIEKLGADKIYSVIVTHPHEDHVGGMSKIVSKFKPMRAYEPLVPPNLTDGSKTYQYFKESVEANNLYLENPKEDYIIYEDDEYGFTFEVIYGGEEMNSTDINSYSIVTKVTYGGKSFLLTGDSTEEEEREIVRRDIERDDQRLKSDVLLVGHHGSHASTSVSFLSMVNPEAAVISCEKGNQYGHPHGQTLERLSGMQIYRTDNDGTIIAATDGKQIKFYTKCTGNYPLGSKNYDKNIKLPEECLVKYGSHDDEEEEINEGKVKCEYICDTTSNLYHEEDCDCLVKNESLWFKPIDMDELWASGYEPCPECINKWNLY